MSKNVIISIAIPCMVHLTRPFPFFFAFNLQKLKSGEILQKKENLKHKYHLFQIFTYEPAQFLDFSVVTPQLNCNPNFGMDCA